MLLLIFSLGFLKVFNSRFRYEFIHAGNRFRLNAKKALAKRIRRRRKMKRINNNKILIAVFAPCFALAVLAASTFAVDKKIELQSAPVTIESKQTIVRNLNEIPKGTIGTIRLRLKWHGLITAPVPGPPTMPRLTVRLRHGSRTLRRMTCSSVHLNVPDKCRINYSVSLAEANRTGSWNLQISNTYSGIRIYGLDVEKGTDINPAGPSVQIGLPLYPLFLYNKNSQIDRTRKGYSKRRCPGNSA